jgi:hypothetical protein
VVLVVRVAEGQSDVEREDRFVTDLGLNIDGFSVQEQALPAEGFLDMPLSRQIALIKPVMSHRRAVAAMWLHAVSEDMLLLQVVVLDTGRALVRLFEHSLIEGSEEALAVTAAELLGTAYLFEPEKSEQSEPIKTLVQSTREQAGVQVKRPSLWCWYVAPFGRGVFLDLKGPRLRIGGFLGAERVFYDDFFLTLSLGGIAGPWGHANESTFSGFEVLAKIDAFWGPALKRVRFGPVLNLFGGPLTVMVERRGFPREIYTFWALHGGIGAALRIPLHEKVALRFDLGISASPTRMTVRLRSTDEILFKEGIMSGFGSVGGLFF